MDFKKLTIIINSSLPNEVKELQIIDCLSKDKNVIPLIMKILDREREVKKEISQEMNVLLSKTHLALDNPKYNEDNFMQKEIIEFYTKYKDQIGHCFKNLFDK